LQKTTTDLIDLAPDSTAPTIFLASFSIRRNSFARRTRAWMSFAAKRIRSEELFTNKFYKCGK
jgi:hypothetical protein